MMRYLKSVLMAAVMVAATTCGCRMTSSHIGGRIDAPQMPAAALKTECFVHRYEQDGSYYMTRQNHDVAAAVGYVRISGTEPDGHYVWQFAMGVFTPVEGLATGMKWLPESIAPADYCRLVLGCFRASMAQQDHGDVPVRILGNWAYQVKVEGDITWYKSSDSSAAADIIVMQRTDGTQLIARGYGYHVAGTGELLIPAKIEVFTANSATMTEQMLLRLEYTD